jgi:tRNA G18 (ribose-2'-O)-methylase SpoU
VARLIELDDPADPRLADYVALRDVQLRKNLEAEYGFFIAEGEKVVRRAVAAGFTPRSFLMTQRWIEGLSAELAAAGDAPCYVVDEHVAELVTGFHVHRGALASLRRQPLPTVDEVIEGARTIVLLEDIVDHTNVGAIARNAAALGVDAMLLSPRCADPLYRRSIKVAMGAVFTLPWTRVEGWYDALAQLRAAGFTTLALTPDADAQDLAALHRSGESEKLCLILGSEGPGISSRWLAGADRRVRIAMTRDVDSLNVAAAAAVAFYALQTARARKEPHG